MDPLEEVKKPERPVLLLHGDQDILTLIEGIRRVAEGLPHGTLAPVTTFQHPETPLIPAILPYLHRWFNHSDLKFNPEVFQRAAAWLRQRQT